MSVCEAYSVKVLRYLDHDLQGAELTDFHGHLETCTHCRATLEAEQELSRVLHGSRPLYSAPPALRARVSAALAAHAASTPSRDSLYERVSQRLESTWARAWRPSSLRLLAPAAVTIALLLAFVPNVVRNVRAANYVETAATAHRSFVDGNLPVALRSTSPEAVTAWFDGKVPFHFRLPNAQAVPDSVPAYRLTGADLVTYRGSPAALVTYEREKEKISLMVAASSSAVVAGGEEVRLGSLTFHYRTSQGFKVITWSNHGLSYALVSSISGSARESCMVCHQSMADHQKFRSAL